jgi:hypothetical protein
VPFGGNWDEYYTEVSAPAISDAGLIAVHADEVFRAGSIRDLVSGGYGRYLADTAVANAAARTGK